MRKSQVYQKERVPPLSMIAVAIMLVPGRGVLAMDFDVGKRAVRTACEIGSRAAADAGLTKAVLQMNDLLKSGMFDRHAVRSVGESGHFTRRVNAALRLRSSARESSGRYEYIQLKTSGALKFKPSGELSSSGNPVVVYGGIVGDSVLMSNHSELYYDNSVPDCNSLQLGLKFMVDRWWQGEEW